MSTTMPKAGQIDRKWYVIDAAGKPLAQLLEELGYQAGRIAVERNGEIVPKAQYGAVTLEDGDTLEVVRFVGGG